MGGARIAQRWRAIVPDQTFDQSSGRYERLRASASNGREALHQDINRVFGNLNDGESSGATAQWSPAVDIREYNDRFQLLLDVPGVEPKDVEITLDNGVLTVSGTRLEGQVVGSNGTEQPQQRHGVLEIAIRKQAKAQPRRIEVR